MRHIDPNSNSSANKNSYSKYRGNYSILTKDKQSKKSRSKYNHHKHKHKQNRYHHRKSPNSQGFSYSHRVRFEDSAKQEISSKHKSRVSKSTGSLREVLVISTIMEQHNNNDNTNTNDNNDDGDGGTQEQQSSDPNDAELEQTPASQNDGSKQVTFLQTNYPSVIEYDNDESSETSSRVGFNKTGSQSAEPQAIGQSIQSNQSQQQQQQPGHYHNGSGNNSNNSIGAVGGLFRRHSSSRGKDFVSLRDRSASSPKMLSKDIFNNKDVEQISKLARKYSRRGIPGVCILICIIAFDLVYYLFCVW